MPSISDAAADDAMDERSAPTDFIRDEAMETHGGDDDASGARGIARGSRDWSDADFEIPAGDGTDDGVKNAGRGNDREIAADGGGGGGGGADFEAGKNDADGAEFVAIAAGEGGDGDDGSADGSGKGPRTAFERGRASAMELDGDPTPLEGTSRGAHQEFLHESSAAFATRPPPAPFRNRKQDGFVKQGARVKALLATALRSVAKGAAAAAPGDAGADPCGNAAAGGGEGGGCDSSRGGDDDSHQPRGRWHARTDFAHARDLAREKAEECMALKRKLEELQSQIETLQSENSASQQANSQLKAKIDRTVEALQIAGANAANARAEADASNARAESLSSQLNDLQAAIEETRRGFEAVRGEHDECSRAARSVEGRLIQVESELVRAASAKSHAVEERDILKARAEKSEKLVRDLQEKVDDYHDETRMLKKDLLELDEQLKLRSERTQRIESEFQEARAGLLEATCAAAEAESTVASLRSVIEELRRENETLHERMDESRDAVAKERSKQHDALAIAEREAQKWKMKCEEGDEESRKLKMDKASAEKQVDQLKSRVANLERRLNDSSKQFARSEKPAAAAASAAVASTTVTPNAPSSSGDHGLGFIGSFSAKDASSVISDDSKKRKFVQELPMREPASTAASSNSSSRRLSYSYQKEKENVTTAANKVVAHQVNEPFSSGPSRKQVVRTNKCCLCSKEGGMILKCQCDNFNCEKRAHAICIGKFRGPNKDRDEKTILCSID